MTVEIKYILITFLVCASQLFQLAIIGFLIRKIDPKLNFIISCFISYLLIIITGIYYLNVSYIILIGSLLLLTSCILINFTFWTILIWGFSVSLLETLDRKKKITKFKWIKLYTGNRNLNTFTNDRIRLLFILKSIFKKKDNSYKSNIVGTLITKVYKFMEKYFFYV